MHAEQFLIYLLLGGFALLQFLVTALKRWREQQIAQQSSPEPPARAPDERWWSPDPETAPPKVRSEAAPRPAAPRPHAPERSAARPSPRPAAKQLRRQARAEPASQHRIALGDRTELRRAVQLTIILGPPRSLAPDES